LCSWQTQEQSYRAAAPDVQAPAARPGPQSSSCVRHATPRFVQ